MKELSLEKMKPLTKAVSNSLNSVFGFSLFGIGKDVLK